jgi:hypothetical protein
MTDTTIVFVAFVIDDERRRDFLKAHTRHSCAPFEFVDTSVKQPYDSNWKDRVRTRIRRSHGVIALVSKNLLTSTGQKWEIRCAKEEGKPPRGIWAYTARQDQPCGCRDLCVERQEHRRLHRLTVGTGHA